MRKPGRPAKERKTISVDQAVQLTKEFWARFDKPGYAKGTIYNYISSGKLQKKKIRNDVLVYEDEIREKLCG